MKVPKARKLPSGSWFIQLRLGGESYSITAPSEKECIKQAELAKAEYRNGKGLAKEKPESLTLRKAVDNYISARTNVLSPATIRGYNTIRDNRFQGVMDKPVESISDWQKICNLEAKNCSAKTLKNSWLFIASVLKETTGQLAPRVKLPQVVIVERPYLEPDDIPRFVAAMRGKKGEIPALLALHSLRRSEICALTWDKIDLKNQRIHVSGAVVADENSKFVEKKTNKNRDSQRYVPIMIPELKYALEACEDKTGHIVTCNPNTLRDWINSACEASGLPKVGVHGLRHPYVKHKTKKYESFYALKSSANL